MVFSLSKKNISLIKQCWTSWLNKDCWCGDQTSPSDHWNLRREKKKKKKFPCTPPPSQAKETLQDAILSWLFIQNHGFQHLKLPSSMPWEYINFQYIKFSMNSTFGSVSELVTEKKAVFFFSHVPAPYSAVWADLQDMPQLEQRAAATVFSSCGVSHSCKEDATHAELLELSTPHLQFGCSAVTSWKGSVIGTASHRDRQPAMWPTC